jgi:AraC-like DNA-binding protein
MRPEMIEFEDGIPVRVFVRSVENYPYHWHNTLEIIRVLKGSVNIGVGDEYLTLNKNDIAVINTEELHRIVSNPQKTTDNLILFIHVDSAYYQNRLAENSFVFLYCCSAYHEAMVPYKYEKLREYISLLMSELVQKTPYEGDIKTESTINTMLDYLTYHFDFLRWGYGTVPFSEKLVERLKQIAKHATSNDEIRLSLEGLAKEAGVTLKHLSADIKDKFGLTFQELLYYGKCAQASKLLLCTDRRIIDIALECGFSDVKYFVKYFRRYFHCNPSEFRKMNRIDDQIPENQMKYHDYPLAENSTIFS